MGKYFSIKSIYKIITTIIAIIILGFVLFQINAVFQNNITFSSDIFSADVLDKDIDPDASIWPSSANRSSSMVVIEESTLRVLSQSNKDMRLEMASTTKIMTALVVLENLPLDKQITVDDSAVGVEGSSIYIKRGEIWTIRDLLYGLMLRSGNDAATALAIATAGSVEDFAVMMNEKAERLGLKNTRFENPHGLHADGHYTSAYDLAVISACAMRNEDFKTIVGTKMYAVEGNETHPTYYFANKNKMLSVYDGANGIKTGYTKDSGRCLVSSAERNGMQLICVVLNIYDTYNTCATNMNKVFDEYIPVEVGKSGDIMETFDFDGEKYEIALAGDLVIPLKDGESFKLNCRFNISDELSAPLESGSIIGKLEFYDDNRLLFCADIVNIDNINDTGALRKLSAYVGDWRISHTNGETEQIFSVDRSVVETRRG